MTSRHLSQEIVSLIHHVELNESGWRKKAIGQVVKAVLWKAGGAQTIAAIKQGLNRELGIRLAGDELQKQLDMLSSQGAVTQMTGPVYKLTEQAHQVLTVAHDNAVAEQKQCHTAFLASCAEHCPELNAEDVWEHFIKALLDAVHVAGANLFHLLADGNLEKEFDWLSILLNKFPTTSLHGVRKVFSVFFASGNHVCRNQVLRFLTAHFFAEASQLGPETIAALEGAQKKRTIKVVLDTNFIFSILLLHDNPANEAAQSLVEIAKQQNKLLDLKLYVLPGTLEEAQRTLAHQVQLIERIRTTQAMARVAVTQPLPSIAKKFFEAAQNTPGLTAKSFFQPYIDDLRTILRGKDIHFLDASPAIYHQRPDVIDDVLDEQRREDAEVPEPRRKGYEKLLHDVVLWHAVKDRRATAADSPFDVEYWAVSIDWRLIAFDRKKRDANASKLPVVLHPSNLIQLIQFWIPRSEKLEEGLVDSLKISLFFQSFDADDERATMKVLNAISRFEDVGDIPESTLKVVLANQVLRGRLREADASNDEAFALVREELLAEHGNVVKALDVVKGSLAQTEASLDLERSNRKVSEQLLGSTSVMLEEASQRVVEAEKRAADAETARLQQITDAEIKLQEKSNQASAIETTLLKLRFTIFFIVLPVVAGIGLGFTFHTLALLFLTQQTHQWGILLATIFGALLPFALSCMYVPTYIKNKPSIENWKLARIVAFLGKKALVGPAGVAFIGAFQGGVWDALKLLVGWPGS